MCPGFIARSIARSVIDHDRLEPAISRKAIKDATDLSGFIQGRNDDRDERLFLERF